MARTQDNTRSRVRPTADAAQSRPPRLPGVKLLPSPVRKLLHDRAIDVLRQDGPTPDYDHPLGDAGLFGPDTVTWKIHADFPAMMAGGLAALMMQSLHPLALSGIWDHSDFRGEMLARLRGTIAFVARTTYAPREPAEQAIARVRSIHRNVHGTAPDGRPYSAEDPHLLNWVHCTQVWCYLRGYQSYCHRGVPRNLQDRYLQETVRVAGALGARDMPTSVTGLEAFFDSVRGELAYDARTRDVLGALHTIRLPIPFAGFSRSLFLGAGAALLPEWALSLMARSRLQRLRDRAAARLLAVIAPSIRAAMAEGGLAWRACARTGVDYEALFRWPDNA